MVGPGGVEAETFAGADATGAACALIDRGAGALEEGKEEGERRKGRGRNEKKRRRRYEEKMIRGEEDKRRRRGQKWNIWTRDHRRTQMIIWDNDT